MGPKRAVANVRAQFRLDLNYWSSYIPVPKTTNAKQGYRTESQFCSDFAESQFCSDFVWRGPAPPKLRVHILAYSSLPPYFLFLLFLSLWCDVEYISIEPDIPIDPSVTETCEPFTKVLIFVGPQNALSKKHRGRQHLSPKTRPATDDAHRWQGLAAAR